MLAHLNEEQHITMILVTHDVDTVSNRISHVACLNQTIHFHGYKNDFDAISVKQNLMLGTDTLFERFTKEE